MHLEGPQTSQINPNNNSFQEMSTCFTHKLKVRPGKLVSKKNTSKWPIFRCTNLYFLTLEGTGHPNVDTKSTSGVPLEIFVEGRWHQN